VNDRHDVLDEAEDGSDEADASPPPLSYRALALDALSGVPSPSDDESMPHDAFEVWAKEGSDQTAILRFFDAGSAMAYAAYLPDGGDPATEATEIARILQARERLSPPEHERPVAPNDWVPLRMPVALERLGRTLGLIQLEQGLTVEAEMIGAGDEAVWKEYFRVYYLDPAVRPDDDDAPEDADDEQRQVGCLEELSELVGELVRTPEVLWSPEKDSSGEWRVEILRHRSYRDLIVLCGLSGEGSEHAAISHLPAAGLLTEDEVTQALQDLRAMIDDRGIFSDRPRPLAADCPFEHVPANEVQPLLEERFVEPERVTGIVVGFTEEDGVSVTLG
jgi:hypothetical protein